MTSRRDRIKAHFPTDTVEVYAGDDLRTTTVSVTSRNFEGLPPDDRGAPIRLMARDPRLRVRAGTPFEIKTLV